MMEFEKGGRISSNLIISIDELVSVENEELRFKLVSINLSITLTW